MTLAEVSAVSGQAGDFTVEVVEHPRYVDMDKCIACGMCADKCPKKVPDPYNQNLVKRKAAYVQYAQAVPLKYAIDAENCIYLTRGKCRACQKFCPTGAIDFEQKETRRTLNVGALVLATGSEAYDPGVHDTYGYRKSPNIVTSLEFERLLSASGPTGGHLVRPSDGKAPAKIAWLQCVGSRDEHIDRGYCSAVCCTYAVKEAMLAKEHAGSGLDTAVFYIDMRTNGKDFEQYYNRAAEEMGVRFVKSRVTDLPPEPGTGRHRVCYVDASGRRVEEAFDIVVLSVGLGVSEQATRLAAKLGIELDAYGYAAGGSFAPVATSRAGIYVCGAFQAPKDIPSSVIDSSAAAGAVGSRLSAARWSLTRKKEVPAELDLRREPERIGVFVCCCGTNIAGVVDVPAVVEYARSLPNVAYAEQNMFSCSQDTQDKITEVIREQKLNRVVVAACTPKTHEPLFQETLTNASVNKYLFEMANIRNQCSWVHKDDPAAATVKAKELVRMAVAKAALLKPLEEPSLPVNHAALVIGGGIAGMEAARNLADQGFHTYLVERSSELGGQARHIASTWRGEDVQAYLKELIATVDAHPQIDVYRNARIRTVEGFVGNFKTDIAVNGDRYLLEHGATIIASGAAEYKPDQYLYGRDPRVVTGLELQQRFVDGDAALKRVGSAVFVQCVGSRIAERPYCSKVCCTESINSALQLKALNPQMQVYILYRQMRPYGLREDLYRQARNAGIVFLRYDTARPLAADLDQEELCVSFSDCILKRRMEIRPDLLVLATAIVPPKENALAQLFKIPQNADGFFMEAHVKLRPVDCATNGIFICGLAHAPKSIDESIAQAQAAAARAVTVLSLSEIKGLGQVSHIDAALCSGCLGCINVCPYGAITFDDRKRVAEINPALCKGCGACAAACPSEAPVLMGFDNREIYAQIRGAFRG